MDMTPSVGPRFGFMSGLARRRVVAESSKDRANRVGKDDVSSKPLAATLLIDQAVL